MSDKIDNLLTGVIILLVMVVMWKWYQDPACADGVRLSCGCEQHKCECKKEPFSDKVPPLSRREFLATHRAPDKLASAVLAGDYNAAVKDMSLEVEVGASHKRYCDALSFAGLPTGSSACTELEETGRSINTANFVGLTARKFCKARNLAVPGEGARVTSSKDIIEWCGMPQDSLI